MYPRESPGSYIVRLTSYHSRLAACGDREVVRACSLKHGIQGSLSSQDEPLSFAGPQPGRRARSSRRTASIASSSGMSAGFGRGAAAAPRIHYSGPHVAEVVAGAKITSAGPWPVCLPPRCGHSEASPLDAVLRLRVTLVRTAICASIDEAGRVRADYTPPSGSKE